MGLSLVYITINDLLHKKARVEMPPQHGTFKEAQRVQQEANGENGLLVA